jgi:hypothetical protein
MIIVWTWFGPGLVGSGLREHFRFILLFQMTGLVPGLSQVFFRKKSLPKKKEKERKRKIKEKNI